MSMFFYINHAICNYCGKSGHKKEMIKDEISYHTYDDITFKKVWFHEECYKKEFKVERCRCGNSWVKTMGGM